MPTAEQMKLVQARVRLALLVEAPTGALRLQLVDDIKLVLQELTRRDTTPAPQEDEPPNIAALRASCERVTRLLDDAHPGLFTWRLALAEAADEVAQYGTNPPQKKTT